MSLSIAWEMIPGDSLFRELSNLAPAQRNLFMVIAEEALRFNQTNEEFLTLGEFYNMFYDSSSAK